MYSKCFLSDTSRYAFSRNALISLIGVLLLPVVLAGCSDNPVSGGNEVENPSERPTTFEVEGSLSQRQINGSETWIIERARGENYLPINLMRDDLKEGLQVRVEVRPVAPEFIENRRDEIERNLPETTVIDGTSARLVQIESFEVVTDTEGAVETNQWYYNPSLRIDSKGV